ncbi:MmgE/PrpD family protein [Chitinophaga pendula]|uniref:MmgE/PrpD family protein n=1 Tax=Chitinophaga TaxID=79328 RepID=UPI000BB01FD0|nr:MULTISPECIES: MmgE/PrpD family protein [Chitinophaga]ASZ14185.1 2-methylcitrate dehydratase [Chitinophaga sp. MD30]UCJ08179.1 MmgE/PrpD family protein [Chitinophaga pendula]
MKKQNITEHITHKIMQFAAQTSYEHLEEATVMQLKRHLLDSVASMIWATGQPTVHKLLKQVQQLQPEGVCPVPVIGTTGVDRAAQVFTLLNRYPDFMDNFIGKDATCHPSDNIGAILAAAQWINAGGREVLISMATAYQIQCTLIEQMPVMAKGIDHTALLACSITAALSPLLSLTEEQGAHAIGIAASTFNTTVTSRASYTYEWKGYASSLVALGCMQIVLLARNGVTGPLAYFEGPMGFEEEFDMKAAFKNEKRDLSRIPRCILKSYNAEVHTQSAIEALLELRSQLNAEERQQVAGISLTTFLTAYHITGGGKYGDRKHVATKEQADHSLPYLLAVAWLDGQVMPEQLMPERIRSADVQALLQKVEVDTVLPLKTPRKLAEKIDPYTIAYPEKLEAKVKITLDDGRIWHHKKDDFTGFHTRPLSWEQVVSKFRQLTISAIDTDLQDKIIDLISTFDHQKAADLVKLLCQVPAKLSAS